MAGRTAGTIESVNVRVDQAWVDRTRVDQTRVGWDREPELVGGPKILLLTDPFEVL